ncbi:squalene/phytoene synthase family protein [Novispirillum itersonii]|uniref:squalene/phytoene synthase family protein n=1 Tax=Novispirillum itersonii TaxID=189 RepID=UPI0009DB9B94|nr:squalene/phytoene synthase family protein [Novispirillum itersonii]
MTLFNQSGQSKSASPHTAEPLSTVPGGRDRPQGKTERDEAFPVAALLPAAHRGTVRQFYRLVRAADDVADSPHLSGEEKRRQLAILRQQAADTLPPAVAPEAAALIDAFTADTDHAPCRTWAETLASARASSAPVGRMLLRLHERDVLTAAPAADCLCTALQLLNHISDAEEDRLRLGRSYLPADWLAEAAGDPAPVLERMRQATLPLLVAARPLVWQIRSPRLAFQAAVTLACGYRLSALLAHRPDWRIAPRFGRRAMLRAGGYGIWLFLSLRWRG